MTEPVATASHSDSALDQDLPAPQLEMGSSPVARWLAAGMAGLAVILALVVTFFINLFPLAAVDFWWQAKTGDLIVNGGGIPRQDPFSWTAHGQPWMVHEWMVEVLFYLLLAKTPAWTLVAYKCGLAAAACGLVLVRGWRRSGSIALGIVAAVGCAWVMRNYADLRPQMLTFILLAGLFLALDDYREGGLRRLPWILPLIFALWANLHGGVVVGLILVGIWLLGETLGRWLLREPSEGLAGLTMGWLGSLLAVALNPNGFHVYTYPFQVLGHPEVTDYITEWFSPNFHIPEMRPFLFILLATLGVLALRSPRPGERRCGEAVVLAATAYAALTAQRNTVPFAILAAPVVAGGLGLLLREAPALRSWREAAALPATRAVGFLALSVLLASHLGYSLPRRSIATGGKTRTEMVPPHEWADYGLARSYFPEAAVEQLRAGRWPGLMYNDYVWGGYLIWTLHPHRPVFIDGRAEVYYPTRAFEDEMTIHNTAAGWEAALDRRGVDVILTHRNGYLSRALTRAPGWRWVFSGPVEVIYVRAKSKAAGELPPIPSF